MSYYRVIPRDLFNEAKLLKCLGFLTLRIHDGLLPDLAFQHDGEPFHIVQNESDGDLIVINLSFRTPRGRSVTFTSKYNDKSNFPLLYHTEDGDFDYVFYDNGEFTEWFLRALEELSK